MKNRLNRKQFGKKAYVRTIEAFAAFFITFIFILVLILHTQAVQPKIAPQNVLSTLEFDETFRECVIANNFTCLDSKIQERLSSRFDFTLKVDDLGALPYQQKQIFVESLFLTTDTTEDYRIVKLHYWYK